MDEAIVVSLNRWAGYGNWPDYVAWFIAEWGLALQLFLLLIRWFFPGARPVRERQTLLLAAAGAVFALGLSQVTELFSYRTRPYLSVPGVFDLLGGGPSDAFPSQHAVVAFSLALGMGLGSPVLAAPLWLLALGMAWARVYAGVHYPTDMLGSLFFALLVTLIYRALRRELEPALCRILKLLGGLTAGSGGRPGES